ncbi:acyl-CoA thioesterase [Microbacterium sp.]|uniref:acyl-CoA thioesterase n=1 Tax=Microbacterium sp. TaxID=51671 RepID=UPI003A86E7E1
MTDGGVRLHIPIALRWGDLDAFAHVNNATMLRLLEEARIRAFWAPLPGEDAPPTAVIDSGADSGVQMFVARQEIDYLAPVPYRRPPLDVQMWFGALGGSSADVCYEVFSSPPGGEPTLHVRATTVVVVVDAASGSPTRLTAEMRAAWAPYVGVPLRYRGRP